MPNTTTVPGTYAYETFTNDDGVIVTRILLKDFVRSDIKRNLQHQSPIVITLDKSLPDNVSGNAVINGKYDYATPDNFSDRKVFMRILSDDRKTIELMSQSR